MPFFCSKLFPPCWSQWCLQKSYFFCTFKKASLKISESVYQEWRSQKSILCLRFEKASLKIQVFPQCWMKLVFPHSVRSTTGLLYPSTKEFLFFCFCFFKDIPPPPPPPHTHTHIIQSETGFSKNWFLQTFAGLEKAHLNKTAWYFFRTVKMGV